jgi:proteasome lid subunit RPN8/RPN11
MKIGISRAVFDQIVTHAAENPSEEICGLLLGRAGSVEAILPAANVAAERTTMFELDPAMLFQAYRAARAGGPAILGHYHSHPNGSAVPSAADAAAAEPGLLWLILGDGKAALFEARRDGAIHGRFTALKYELL